MPTEAAVSTSLKEICSSCYIQRSDGRRCLDTRISRSIDVDRSTLVSTWLNVPRQQGSPLSDCYGKTGRSLLPSPARNVLLWINLSLRYSTSIPCRAPMPSFNSRHPSTDTISLFECLSFWGVQVQDPRKFPLISSNEQPGRYAAFRRRDNMPLLRLELWPSGRHVNGTARQIGLATMT